MKKILFVGNINSFLIINLAKSLKEVDNNIQIDILSDQKKNNDTKDLFLNVYSINNHHFLNKIKFAKGIFQSLSFKNEIKKIETTYDAVHILYLSVSYRTIWRKLIEISQKQIITVFGGDFYKSTKLMRKLMRPMVESATIITATNPKTLQEFSNFYGIPAKKTRVVRFGLSILDEIDHVNEDDILKFKYKYIIDKNKKLIACGYNASMNQNIEKIIPELLKVQGIQQHYLLCFQFPQTQNSVCEKAISLCKKHKLKFVVFDDYLSDKELAIYRKSIDIMIQLQSTDSFSGAMQEHLYAGSKVITGKWLPYEVLDAKGVDFSRIDRFDKLSETIETIVKREIDILHNQNVIASYSKWKKNIGDWQNLYK